MVNLEGISDLYSRFENVAHEEGVVAYWFARDIQMLLQYTEWRNFELVIQKAMTACESSGQSPKEHFVGVTKMVELGSNSTRGISDYKLTRYACYLIAQNGNPRKEEVAFAQTYFAVQTRKQEILEERLLLAERIQARSKLTETEKQLSNTLYEHGVDDRGFGLIRSRGDSALFGGNSTAQMKTRLGVNARKPLADFLPTVTLKAKEFAAAITEFNVRKENLHGVQPIGNEHVKNNLDVRGVLEKSDIRPEELPAEEDIKKLKRQVGVEEKRLIGTENSLKNV